jgi:hypothetical protein
MTGRCRISHMQIIGRNEILDSRSFAGAAVKSRLRGRAVGVLLQEAWFWRLAYRVVSWLAETRPMAAWRRRELERERHD